jgi:hypothetical protein
MVFMFSPNMYIISIDQDLMCAIQFQSFFIYLDLPDGIF